MREYLHAHASLVAFLIGYASGFVTAATAAYLLVERAKRLAAKPGNN